MVSGVGRLRLGGRNDEGLGKGGEYMKARLLVAAVFVPLLAVVMFFLPEYVFAAVVAIICAISSYEFQHALGYRGNERIVIYSSFSAAIIPIGVYFDYGEIVFTAIIVVMMCLLFFEAIRVYGKKKQITLAQILVTLFGGCILPYLLSTLVALRNMPEGRLFVLLPVISAFVTDGGAYFTGVLIGKTRAFPLISPKKTVEGYIGGLVVGTAIIMLYGAIIIMTTFYDVRFGALAVYGVLGAVVTELGDLAFSMIKREFEVKDYGRLLPGHGGMLDRFDSMVFAAPVIYLLVGLIPAIIID